MSLNKALIMGFVGNDPDVREIGGKKNASFRVACTEKFKDREGNVTEKTEWINVVAWGNTAAVVEKHVSKGTQVLVEGRIQTREWEDRNGAKRYTTEINADRVQTVGKKEGSARSRRQSDDEDLDF